MKTIELQLRVEESKNDYCGASKVSEQQHSQDLREIYNVGRILEFITFTRKHRPLQKIP